MDWMKSWILTLAVSLTLFGCRGVETALTPINDIDATQDNVHFNQVDQIDHQPLDSEEEEYIDEEVSEKDIDELEKNAEDDGKCFEAGNLVENHSFECSDLANNRWNVYGHIPGWQADLDYNDAGLELQCGKVGSLTGSDGPCHLELDAHGKNGFSKSDVLVYQDVPVEKDLCYDVSFDYSPRMNNRAASNEMFVLWNGEKKAHLAGESVGWVNHSFHVHAQDAGARLAFAANIDGDTLGAQLDNVKVAEAACKEDERDDEKSESVADGKDLDDEQGLVCEDSTLAFVWGDIEGNTRKWNNFGYSYVRMLNEHGKIAAQDLIKWDRHDVFYGNEDEKKIAFYTRVITHYDGFSISAKHCYEKGKYENPEFEIVFGDKYKKRIKLKRDKLFSYKKIKGDDVVDGHGLVVLGVKKHASDVHFVAGNWRPKEFKNAKFKNYKGVFNGQVFGNADDDGRIHGKWGAFDKNKQLFHGKVRMNDKSKADVRGKYKKHKKKKHFGVAGGRVYHEDDSKQKLRLRWFNRNGDKRGTLFGWIVDKKKKDDDHGDDLEDNPDDVQEDLHGI